MTLRDLLLEINEETRLINSRNFKVNVADAVSLPSLDDSDITFENFDNLEKKAKIVETCVLYIDMRQSTQLSLEHKPRTLTKLYSSFVRGAIKCAQQFDGKVRNIIGDRVMILFDPKDCFRNAVNSATLLNTFSTYVLNKHFRNDLVRCGIGIDHGRMLAAKTGTIKRGTDSSEYKSLVWLGRPANVASKLCDLANKRFFRPKVRLEHYNPYLLQWHSTHHELEEFFDSLELTYSYPTIARFKEPYWNVLRFFKTLVYNTYSPILMTKTVYDGFRRSCPEEESVRNKWWKPRKLSVSGYNGIVYQGGVFFAFGKELK